MSYLNFLKIVFSVVLFLFSYNSFGQTESIRNLINKDYNKDSIVKLENKYSRPIFKTNNSNYTALYKNQFFIEIDELGNKLKYKTYNQNSAIASKVNQINSGGIKNLNLNGENMIIGMWDFGIPRYSHLDLKDKIVIKDDSSFQNIKNHATHVAGTVVSQGVYNRAGKGLAPKANLWVYNWENDLSKMINFAGQGLLVSNHSYGLDIEGLPDYYFGAYTKNSQAIDAMTYNMKYYLPVVAAGNEREEYLNYNPSKNGSDLLTGMAVSKNGVVVASVDVDPYNMASYNIRVSDFSNWGPTDDFRIKPDISARGHKVLSTTFYNDTSYGFLSGTSMSAPVVASIFSLWQQYYLSLNNESKILTSASIRGIMVHTADKVGSIPGPNHKSGWGLINAARGTDFLTDAMSEHDKDFLKEDTLWQGMQKEYALSLNSPKDITVTLSWTDAEGQIKLGELDNSSPDLVNDLDIVVQKGSELYYPWRLKRDFNNPEAEQGVNDVDNIEKIEIPNAEQGEYIIRITHKNELFSGEQDFSLLVSGIDSIQENIDDEVGECKIWPNPVSGYISISMGNIDMNGGRIDILDLSGRVVQQVPNVFTPKNTIAKVDVSYLDKGVYFVVFKKNKVKRLFKMVKL